MLLVTADFVIKQFNLKGRRKLWHSWQTIRFYRKFGFKTPFLLLRKYSVTNYKLQIFRNRLTLSSIYLLFAYLHTSECCLPSPRLTPQLRS